MAWEFLSCMVHCIQKKFWISTKITVYSLWNFVSNSGHRKFCFGMSIVSVYVYIDYRTTLCVFFLVSEVDCPLNVHSYVGCQRVTARMCRCVQFACCCYRSHGSHCRLHQIPGLSRTPEAFFHDPVISQQCFDIQTDSSY